MPKNISFHETKHLMKNRFGNRVVSTKDNMFQAEKEAAMKQAESASRAAETLMASGGSVDANPADIKELKEALAKAEKEAEVAKKDMTSMKTQSESLAKEYDR